MNKYEILSGLSIGLFAASIVIALIGLLLPCILLFAYFSLIPFTFVYDSVSLIFYFFNIIVLVSAVGALLHEKTGIEIGIFEFFSELIKIIIKFEILAKELYHKLIKHRTFIFKDTGIFFLIFLFSVSLSGGINLITTILFWLFNDYFKFSFVMLKNINTWIINHYPLMNLYTFLFVILFIYLPRIVYLWKTDSDLNKYLSIFPSWKKVVKNIKNGR